ncbi:phage tail protein I [Tritonibacter mobilis]|uniref:phage tail protein I n=1 Tax=Tritonibacter mobilis TaxID=379347 RepID=UPI000895DCFE|nr:phage tail protein I [Tritonibacter mobilis]GLP86303.1 hypothetical protein GCM10007921_18630 [Tritonibacter mobilis]SDX16449.1 phage tail protein, P2 protein I family [Tritonibacter mobilis]
MSDSLLPHNATPPERALEAVTGPAQVPPVLLRAIWDPVSCPVELLPWLAFAFSVDVWDAEWPEETQREAIRRSFEVHQHKGTRQAVERALGAVGFNVDLSEWFEYGGDPHTFRIDAFGEDIFDAGYQIDSDLFARITNLIEHVKPARSHFDLRIGEGFRSECEIRSGTRPAYSHRLDTDPEPRPATASAELVMRTAPRVRTVAALELDPRPRSRRGSVAVAAQTGARVFLISQQLHDVQRRAVA